MLARERRTWTVAMALLGGCAPIPDEVTDTGVNSTPTSSSSEASTGHPPGATTDGSATVASADGTGTSSSDGPVTTMPLDDTSTSAGSEGPESSSGEMMESSDGETSTTGGVVDCHPLLAEVLYDPHGANGGKQWVKLYNPCPDEIDLLGASLGWGGTNYADNGIDLQGTIAAGECFLVGGPMSNDDNYLPMFDLAMDLSGDLQSSGADADGVALFADVEASIEADTIPVDAVIYGGDNSNGLLDAEGDTPEPHVGDAPQEQSIRRTGLDAVWVIEPNPMPNDCPAL